MLLSYFPERLYITELDFSALDEQNKNYFFSCEFSMVEMINKNEAKSEISMIFVQLSSRLVEFLMEWLLVLGLKECLVDCATVCIKSVVILRMHVYFINILMFLLNDQVELSEQGLFLKNSLVSRLS